MSYVSYDSNRLIPAPFVGIQKNYNKTGDGESVGTTFTLTIVGTILAWMGSPRSKIGTQTGANWGGPSDYFWTGSDYPPDEEDVKSDDTTRLSAMIRKQEAIRDLFSQDGLLLSFQSMDLGPAMKCNPRIININFEEDRWYQTFRYTITCECDVLYSAGILLGEDSELDDYISDASESWQFETDEGLPNSDALSRTYRLTHTVSATGKRFYQDDTTLKEAPWQWARKWVKAKLGLDDNIMSSGINQLPGYYGGYNHAKNETMDIKAGSYNATETWIISSGMALENFTVTTTNSQDSAPTNVRIEGEIRGLEKRDSSDWNTVTHSKHYNADTKWATVQGLLVARANLYTGLSMNTTPLSKTVGVNPVEGVITYSYEFDNRASNIVPGAKSEVISVVHSYNVDAFAEVFVLGRIAGPVLQDLGTKRAKTVDVSVELVMDSPTGLNGSILNDMKNYFTYSRPGILDSAGVPVDAAVYNALQLIKAANNPSNYGYTTVFQHQNVESWEPKTARYSWQFGFTYE